MTRRVCAVLNPTAGSWKRYRQGTTAEGRDHIVNSWFAGSPHPFELTILETRTAGDGSECAIRAVRSGADTVMAVGGDGTIREVLEGLCACNDAARLGIIPTGTANVLARAMRIPVNDAPNAANIAVGEFEKRIDLGTCNGQLFALHAGIGLDAMAVHSISPRLKLRTGKFAYVVSAVKAAVGARSCAFTVTYGEGNSEVATSTYSSDQLFAANFRLYAGSYALAPETEVSAHDGYLNLIVCKPASSGLTALFREAIHLQRGTTFEHAATRYSGAAFSVTCNPQMPIQLDGDPSGWTPAKIKVIPGAVRVACLPDNQ